VQENYVIRGGEKGFTRLQLLAQERWPDTAALLARAGLGRGMRVADLGCGSGDVTMGIARLVEPGEAVGIDKDEIKLALARQEAEDRGVENVTFRALNLHDWVEPSGYDAVYTRFVLQHLANPGEMLRRMWASVRPGGALIVEDADLDSFASDPESDGLSLFKRWYAELLRRSGGNAAAARMLPRLFRSAGIPIASIEVIQRHYTDAGAKTLPWSTLDATADGIVSDGIATREEVAAALEDLDRLAKNADSFILGPRVVQVLARR
jgi:ubiquinone/menaquinone biosynthesis C-methylase UbiE